MRIQFQLTADDFAEATQGRTFGQAQFIRLVGLIVAMTIVPQILSPDVPLAVPAPKPPGGLINDLVLPLLPWLLMLLVIWVSVFRVLRKNAGKPWKKRSVRGGPPSRREYWLSVAFFAALILVLLAWSIVAKRRAAAALGAAADPQFSPIADTLFSSLPMTLLLGLLAVFVSRILTPARLWSRQCQLHRPFVVDVFPDKLRVFEPFSSHEFAWEYYQGFVETPNLFVLYPSQLTFSIFPKRAFASSEDRQTFRELLDRCVSERTQAFPVMPLPLPPIPAGPVGSPPPAC